MNPTLPRLLYILAALAWYLLLWHTPVTIFMAACLSCLTLPQYRHLCRKGRIWRQRLERSRPLTRRQRLLRGLTRQAPLGGYIAMILAALITPIATLALLVTPQAAAGFSRLKELQANNFQLPPEWVATLQDWRMSLSEYPRVERLINEFLQKVDAFLGDAISTLLTRGVDVLGGTMSVLWTSFLFVTLTILFTVYAGHLRKISARIFRIPQAMLRRFTLTIHKALRAIMLGIVLVALAQGVLCGIGFSVAGVKQPAFWGMLATLVAPIPMVGTALVWLPLCLSLWFTGQNHGRRGPGPLGHVGCGRRGQCAAAPVFAAGHQRAVFCVDHCHSLRPGQFWPRGAHRRPRAAGLCHAGGRRRQPHLPAWLIRTALFTITARARANARQNWPRVCRRCSFCCWRCNWSWPRRRWPPWAACARPYSSI